MNSIQLRRLAIYGRNTQRRLSSGSTASSFGSIPISRQKTQSDQQNDGGAQRSSWPWSQWTCPQCSYCGGRSTWQQSRQRETSPFSPIYGIIGFANDSLHKLEHQLRNVTERVQHTEERAMSGEASRSAMLNPMLATNDRIYTDAQGNRRYEVVAQLRGFSDDEVTLRTHDNCLIIHARKDDKKDKSTSLCEFSQRYALPDDLRGVEDLTAKWSQDGDTLCITGLLSKFDSKVVPIEREERAKTVTDAKGPDTDRCIAPHPPFETDM